MSDNTKRRSEPQISPTGICEECGVKYYARAQLMPVYASHSADVTMWLCPGCHKKRLEQLQAMYRGE